MSSGNPSVELAPLRGSIEINLDALENLEESINNLKEDLTDLSSSIEFTTNIDTLVDQLHELTDGLGDLTEHLTISSNIDDILEQLNSLKDDVTSLDATITFTTNIDDLIDEIDSIKDNLTDVHSIISIESNIPEVLGQVNELKKALEDSFNIDVNGNIGNFESKLDSVTEAMQGLKNMSEEEIEFLKSLGATVEELQGRLGGLGASTASASDEMASSFEETISSADELRGTLSRLEITLGSLKYMSDIKGNLTVEGITSTLGELDELQSEIARVMSTVEDLDSSFDITEEDFEEITGRAESASASIFDLQEKVAGLGERSSNTSHETESLGKKLLEEGQNALWNGQMIGSMMSPIKTVGEQMFELGLKTSSALTVNNHMFGQNAGAVDNWSKTTVNSMGLAQDSALSTALQFGMSARTLGANKLQAMGLAEGYTQLAQHINLGTQGSISYEQASQACLQAMAGQTYGLEALGISFNTSNENAEAAALGYGKAYKALDPVQQATVRLKLAEKELNKEFGTTSQDLNTNYGQWVKTKAQLEQTGATIGEQLVPTVLKAAKGIEELAKEFSKLSPTEKDVVLGMMGLVAVAGPLMETYGLVKLLMGGVETVLEAMGLKAVKSAGEVAKTGEVIEVASEGAEDSLGILALAFNPITLALGAVGLASFALYEAWKHNFMGIRTETDKAWSEITTRTEHQWQNIKNDSEKGWDYLVKGWHEMTTKVSSEAEHGYQEIVSKSKHQWQNIKNDSEKGWNYITTGWHHMTSEIGNTITSWWSSQKESWESGYDALKSSAESWWNSQKTMYDDEVQKITSTWDKCKAKTISGWNSIKTTVDTALHDTLSAIERTPFVQQISKIVHSIVNLGAHCRQAIDEITEALVHAVIHRIENMGAQLEQIGENISHRFERVWQEIKQSTERYMSEIDQIFSDKWNSLCSWFDANVERPAKQAERMLDRFGNYIESGMQEAETSFASEWNSLCGWFAGNVERPAEHVAQMFSQFVSSVGNGIQEAQNSFDSGWSALCGWFSGNVNRISMSVSQMFSQFVSSVGSGIQEAQSSFDSGWSSLCGWFDGAVQGPVNSVDAMGSEFESSISNAIQSASSSFQSGWSSLCGWFGGASHEIVSEADNLCGAMMSAGENIMSNLMSGLENGWYSVTNWVANEINGLANEVSSEASNIVGDITSWGNDGSHATGLAYVPWDGYRAELHKGEMVLTAEQAESYKKGGTSGNAGNTYNFYSPEPIDPFEAKRQMVDASRKLANGFY